jgi:hypothetical protein
MTHSPLCFCDHDEADWQTDKARNSCTQFSSRLHTCCPEAGELSAVSFQFIIHLSPCIASRGWGSEVPQNCDEMAFVWDSHDLRSVGT